MTLQSCSKAERILPGGTLGILGGGQLGRMMGMAARSMGYHVRVMDPESTCPASFVAERFGAATVLVSR